MPQISVFVLLVFAITSVMQFHHHDCDGKIYIHLTTFEDIVIGKSGHALEDCHHNHDGCGGCVQHEHNHVADGESCSMHLGDYKASEIDCDSCDECTTTLLDFVAERECVAGVDDLGVIAVSQCEVFVSRGLFHGNVKLLRAPPVA